MANQGRPKTGTIEDRGPYQFLARYSINGKRPSKTFESREQAQAWLDALEEGAAKGRLEKVFAAHELTVADALLKRLDLKIGLKSIKSEISLTNRVIKHCAELCAMGLYAVKTDDIQDFIALRTSHDLSNASINRELSTLSNMFTVAQSNFSCADLKNPVVQGLRLREPRGRCHRLEQDEERVLLRVADRMAATCATQIGSIIRFACSTAMRLAEIAGMDWLHVNLAQGTVFIEETKNGESRSVPLFPSARTLISDLGVRNTGPVWGSKAAIISAWRRVKAAAIVEAERVVQEEDGDPGLVTRLKDLRFHDLRHEGTSRLFERTNWPSAKIKAVTGHKTDAMLARYTHLRSYTLAAELAALEGGVQAPAPAQRGCAEAEPLPVDRLQRQQWQAVSKSASILKALVASQPIVQIANDFGVSDVAVHKACDRLGVTKPGRGYWLGKHPGGDADLSGMNLR
ncbi:site-specific integrase [uncultured Nevskia sp.]|uniref:tyrosine-type recombinase/integrase n=1 Tax=uncultured Nevskia sp. TaxID=228950 RepID=UPI0025E3CB1A|nr:site-specific integrase [uncultured Nevskia sp.]